MKPKKIILVDDKQSFRNTFKLVLRKIGNNEVVAEASTGKEFLDLLSEHEPDLVFMDIEMPEMNGIVATKKALEINKNLLIIGLSFYDDKNYVEQLINAGAIGYLLKLSDNYDLIETILKYPTSDIFYSKEIYPEKEIEQKQQKSILLVDDVESTRFVLGYTLEKHGYDITTCDSPKKAMNLLSGNQYNLLIIDYLMPDKTGIELVREIRKKQDFEKIPIIILSITKNNKIEERAKKCGVSKVIFKPITANRLIDSVTEVFAD